ncbi:hypothetical protein BH10PSE12_BH10PSE12_18860 [soil metagenome]
MTETTTMERAKMSEQHYFSRKAEIQANLRINAKDFADAAYRKAMGTGDQAAIDAVRVQERALADDLAVLEAAWGVTIEDDDREDQQAKVDRFNAMVADVTARLDKREALAKNIAKGIRLLTENAAEYTKSNEDILAVITRGVRDSPNWRVKTDTFVHMRSLLEMKSFVDAIGGALWDAGIRFRRTDFKFTGRQNLAALAEDGREGMLSSLAEYAPEGSE